MGFITSVPKRKDGVLGEGKREVFREWKKQENGGSDGWKQNSRISDDFTWSLEIFCCVVCNITLLPPHQDVFSWDTIVGIVLFSWIRKCSRKGLKEKESHLKKA